MAAAVGTLINSGDRYHLAIDGRSNYLVLMVSGVYTGGTVAFSASPNGDVAANYIPVLADPMDYVPANAQVESGRTLTANQGASWYFAFPNQAYTDFQIQATTALGGTLSVYAFPYAFPLNVTTSSVAAAPNPNILLEGIYYGLENMRMLIANGMNQTQDYRENIFRSTTGVPTYDA